MGGIGLKKNKDLIKREVIVLVIYVWNNNKDDLLIEAVNIRALYPPQQATRQRNMEGNKKSDISKTLELKSSP